ncbi:Sugar phosphate isomerase/epimerase OS=Streptomyces microflavus OX=1919 GN=Smic_70690 PE=4 SV=1 [Streptomyces microflavus]
MKFYQHNHAEEFSFATDKPEARLYDVLLAETDPDLVYLELDIYWAYCASSPLSKRVDGTKAPLDPLKYVLKHPNRYPLFA